ncbi:MAG: RcnB family protein [Alphaproteobacteria bacterium]|nr:RcnB family protein [Alphaproteobacteria bacterium]
MSDAKNEKNKGNQGNQGNQGGSVDVTIPGTNTGVTITSSGLPVITQSDIDIIRNFYRSDPNAFGGAVKPLPPGIAKNLARGKPIPPGIAKTRFPNGLTSQLPYYQGYEWTMAGNDVLLIAQATNVIVDLFKNSF